MKRTFLICCFALTSACTHNSDSNSKATSPTPVVDAKGDSKSQTVSGSEVAITNPASQFEIDGSILTTGKNLSREAMSFAAAHHFDLSRVFVKDGKVYELSDLAAMNQADFDAFIVNSCSIQVPCTDTSCIDSNNTSRGSEFSVSGEYQFISFDSFFEETKKGDVNDSPEWDSKTGTWAKNTHWDHFKISGEYESSTEGLPVISCRYAKEFDFKEDILDAGTIEHVLKQNFGDLVKIKTIK